MADQKIELEIVLDDGSIKKAFGTIRKEAEKAEKESGNLLGGLGGSLVVLNQGIELFDKFASGIKKAAVEMINLSLEAEKVRVVNAQFAQLAQQNGIAQESFNAAIQESIAGLIDDEDALQLANNAMIRLGQTAQRLPEIFELARKASASGFGDMAANAETLTNAIQTGQVRQLRSLGIIADVTKAQNEFAKSIGLTAAQLTEEQKAYVNANTILEATSKKFKNADADIKTFSDSLARFKVASNEAFERFAVGFDRAFGPSIKAFIDTLTESMNGNGAALKANKISAENLAGAIAMAEAKIVSLNEKLANARTDTQFNTLNRQINETNTLLTELQKRQKAVVNTSTEQANLIKAFPKFSAELEIQKKNEEQKKLALENSMKGLEQYNNALLSSQQQEIAIRQQNLQYIEGDEAKKAEIQNIYNLQKQAEEDRFLKEQLNIKKMNDAEFGITDAQAKKLKEEAEIVHQENLKNIKNKNLADQRTSEEKYLQDAKDSFKNSYALIANVVSSGIGRAFTNVGKALKEGKNGFEAFAEGMVAVAGDIASVFGDMFIKLGVATFFINPIEGLGLILAGGALKAFGGLLSSGSSSPATTGNGGGGLASSDNPNQFNTIPAADEARNNPNSVFNLTIQGDVLDSESTGSRIIALINETIDTKGAMVRMA